VDIAEATLERAAWEYAVDTRGLVGEVGHIERGMDRVGAGEPDTRAIWHADYADVVGAGVNRCQRVDQVGARSCVAGRANWSRFAREGRHIRFGAIRELHLCQVGQDVCTRLPTTVLDVFVERPLDEFQRVALDGGGVFLDHGTGIVIGETAVVGDDVSMLQGVTLGGTGAERGDRHPKIGKGVLLGAGAKVLGNITVGDYAKVASGSVVLKPVPAGCTAAGVPARLVNCPTCDQPAKSMDHTLAEAVYDYVI